MNNIKCVCGKNLSEHETRLCIICGYVHVFCKREDQAQALESGYVAAMTKRN
jgi:hypothetical protein